MSRSVLSTVDEIHDSTDLARVLSTASLDCENGFCKWDWYSCSFRSCGEQCNGMERNKRMEVLLFNEGHGRIIILSDTWVDFDDLGGVFYFY